MSSISLSRSQIDLRALLAAFATVAVTFFAANALTQYTMKRIDRASDDIAFNSAPSIERLAAVRTAVRHTEYLLGLAVTNGGPEERAAVDPALQQLGAEANAYLALPTFAGEKDYWRELNESIVGFHAIVHRTLTELDMGAPGAARLELPAVSTAGDRVTEAASRALEFNAWNGRALALRIKSDRRHATAVAWVANAVCLILTVVAALLVRRQLRRTGALVEAHAALQESRAAELESFAGRAAHDIVNPISATQMSLALAVKHGIQDARVMELIERAQRNLLRVRNLVEGLLQFARAGARPGPGAGSDVRRTVEDVASGIRLTAEAAGIEVQVAAVADCRARCSVGVLTSVLLNLAHNALKYMSAGPGHPRIAFRADERDGFVHVEVEDNGPGIPPGSLHDIFLPYVRGPTHGKDGLGLGLATVKRLCEAHGGRVGVRSTLGAGSVFWFELPLCAEARAAGPAPRDAERLAHAGAGRGPAGGPTEPLDPSPGGAGDSLGG